MELQPEILAHSVQLDTGRSHHLESEHVKYCNFLSGLLLLLVQQFSLL